MIVLGVIELNSSAAGQSVGGEDGQQIACRNHADDRSPVDDGYVSYPFGRHPIRDVDDELIGFGEHDVVAHDVRGPDLVGIGAVGEGPHHVALGGHADRTIRAAPRARRRCRAR